MIPALIGAADRGRAGLLRVIATESGVLSSPGLSSSSTGTGEFAASAFTWLAAAVGIGLMGLALRRAVTAGRATRPTAAPSD